MYTNTFVYLYYRMQQRVHLNFWRYFMIMVFIVEVQGKHWLQNSITWKSLGYIYILCLHTKEWFDFWGTWHGGLESDVQALITQQLNYLAVLVCVFFMCSLVPMQICSLYGFLVHSCIIAISCVQSKTNFLKCRASRLHHKVLILRCFDTHHHNLWLNWTQKGNLG